MNTRNLEIVTWRRSSYSGSGGDCVEVADGFPGILPVRDSKNPAGARLVFEARAWASFIGAVKAAGFPPFI
ncbi:DUF397 domain-containing protein [Streptomyces ipomoeae]|uniref:Putative toxin-antitoxin system, toxin component n=1 Tax=Streptomyces ipomoeae 91-03 TaxID=698759 RepID=L1L6H8_9ACTN|nr:DUF397 domain-containing protein [Streptomyces ipomoeae]EKX68666.1 putative toxin-antitoxin system, toxin component [Streptomyces ipomoeae 91-03]MDX2699252.1 DUF397 domain-containing protein [Streptomyces ipomoeae]MDX2844775.1 DUF397 domain-containing protein [Streptomyces ipomoeae]TQE18917.1 DUF397 domain-containing protein [Streptomyces ipomoeae]